MKIFVTGATGYLGNNLAHKLADMGNEVHAIVRANSSKKILQHPNIVLFKGDVLDKESLLIAMKGCQQVYHTAAKVGLCIGESDDFYKVNVEGTQNVLDAIVQMGVEKAVFTSTCGVVGPSLVEPLNEKSPRIIDIDNVYDSTKKSSEDLIFQYAAKGMHAVVVSPSKVYGPGNISHSLTANGVIDLFLKKGITIIPSPGTYQVCFAFINDVVEGHILAMDYGRSGEKYILGGINVPYQKFFSQIRTKSSNHSRIIQLSKKVFKGLAILQWMSYKTIGSRPYFTSKSIDYLFNNYTFSSDKAINELGYQITSLEEGLQRTIDFLTESQPKQLSV
jgi:nucleoside-diphosphate-sugar epimerase